MKKQKSGKLEQIVEIVPAYDMRDEGYGVHCAELRMVLKGSKGAVQFVLYTGWYLSKTIEFWKDKLVDYNHWNALMKPLPADLGYHSPIPHYKGQKPMKGGKCPYIGCKCYYDGSGLNARRVYEIMLEKGHKGVWAELNKYYKQTFTNGN